MNNELKKPEGTCVHQMRGGARNSTHSPRRAASSRLWDNGHLGLMLPDVSDFVNLGSINKKKKYSPNEIHL